MALVCRICGNANYNRSFTAREMMFGTREAFGYFECSGCGTIQIEQVPDLARHYPDDYLSLGEVDDLDLSRTLPRRMAARLAGSYLNKGHGLLGRLVVSTKPWVAYHYPTYLRDISPRLTFDSRILDFGCGTGRLLQTLHYFGFRDLVGADAFISADIRYPTGVNIIKGSLSDLEPPFDLIMLHHSFEHLPEPKKALTEIRRLLAHNGAVLIRMPVVSEAWKTYGADWVQLDPPRHLFLFTESGFTSLAGEQGFVVERIVYDSTALQFWGSEQYRLDIPLNDPRSHEYSHAGTVFEAAQIDDWCRQAEQLNSEGEGDQACFYLRKATT